MASSVVIVDDSKFQTMQLGRFFSDVMGFQVLATGENGEEAVELYRTHKPDLITMDLTMPKLDGRGALTRILGEFPDAKVLVISAVKGPLLLDCLSIGAKSYIEKPLRFDKEDFVRDFKATIGEILQSS
ncbi:MAG: response regulator receiver protein [Fibrobacteres bacterium]|nr:response regulator receiver protein [Fibrobacterota bacterium]